MGGGGEFVYDYTQSTVNNGVTIFNGWTLQLSNNLINCYQAGFKCDGSDEKNTFLTCVGLGLVIEIPANVTISSSLFDPTWVYGEGFVQVIGLDGSDLSLYAVRSLNPYPNTVNSHGSVIRSQARGNFERGSGGSLLVNAPSGFRPQVSGYKTLAGMAAYPNTDTVGQFIYVKTKDPVILTGNLTYSSTGVTSTLITTTLDISVGDFIRAGDSIRGWVKSLDLPNNTITVHGWVHDTEGVNITPTANSPLRIPDGTAVWGINTVVELSPTDKATQLIGMELDVLINRGQGDWLMADGYHATSMVMGGQSAFKANGVGWDYAVNVATTTTYGLYGNNTTKYMVQHTGGDTTVWSIQNNTAVKSDTCNVGLRSVNTPTAIQHTATTSTSTAVLVDADMGYITRSVINGDTRYTMDQNGRVNHNRSLYSVLTASVTITYQTVNNLILCNNTSAIDVTLGAFIAGELLEIVALTDVNVNIKGSDGSTLATLNSTKNKYVKLFLADNNIWVVLTPLS